MDNKKVTRRAVIGTAIGAVAVSPFIIRALKSTYQVEALDDNYIAEWEKYVKNVAVPIKEIDGPSTFELDIKLQLGEQFRVVSLFGSYNNASYPQTPRVYFAAHGNVTIVPPIAGDRLALLLKVGSMATRSRHRLNKTPANEYIAVPNNGGLDYFEMFQNVPKKVSLAKVAISCYELGSGITFDYPKGIVLTKGKHWSIPEISEHGVELDCEIAGYADVAGRKTVKILAKRHLNHQEYMNYITRMGQKLKEVEKERDSGFDVMSDIQRELKEARDNGSTKEWHITCFVDLKTGLALRKEFMTKIHTSKARRTHDSGFTITQMLHS